MKKTKKIESYSVNNDFVITNFTTNNDYACFEFLGLVNLSEVLVNCVICNYKKENKNHNYCPNCGKAY
jgi:hypothetical protein